MKRKQFIKRTIKGSLGMVAGSTLLSSCSEPVEQGIATPAVNFNQSFKWRMVSVWPKNFPVFGEADNKFIEWVELMSGGRLQIKLFAKGELVPALETFDTVQDGTADIGSGCAYYWQGKTPASAFFATSPFGMNAQQHQSWLQAGGGLELWREAYRPFNLLPFVSGNTGVQMGGWFNKTIDSVSDLRGLKMRIPGIGAKALEKAGGAAMNVPGGEIYTNLERGVIDATEWVGPFHDYKMGFPKVAKYYYTPGWHEPGTQLEYFVNIKAFEKLPSDLQAIVEAGAARVQAWMLSELDVKNAEYLQKIADGSTEIRTFPMEVLRELKSYTIEAIAELVEKDELAKKVADSYYSFKDQLKSWTDITEKVYYNTIQEI
ncbi:MAG: TRAP transporter substrate-binding protein [Saprospiraceae bacterium]|jgi:TRAP-type mannitol/chloroaromatic compound transport system substrate-binding protein